MHNKFHSSSSHPQYGICIQPIREIHPGRFPAGIGAEGANPGLKKWLKPGFPDGFGLLQADAGNACSELQNLRYLRDFRAFVNESPGKLSNISVQMRAIFSELRASRDQVYGTSNPVLPQQPKFG